jgi:hypothetical protein
MRKSLGVIVFVFVLALASSAFAALGSYSVVKSKYADPFAVDVSTMTKLSSITSTTSWTKVSLPSPLVDGTGASTFVMVKKGSSTNTNVMIHFEYGGACADYTTCGSILSGGSVITLNPSFTTLSLSNTGGIFSNSNTNNPFRNWTIVFVPFGTGDIHMGNRVVKYTSGLSSRTVYHTGYVNAIVAMRWIKSQKTWSKVAVTGSSAGGYGTILHAYSAYTIFNQPVYTINDSGPGLNAGSSSDMQNAALGDRWGSYENFPGGAITDKSRQLLYFVEYTLKNCTNCYYGIFETLQDSTIASFEGLTGAEHQSQLLSVVKDIDSRWDSRFGYYLPSGTDHTILTSSRFYTTRLSSTYLYNWVKNILNGTTGDLSAQ